MSGTMPYWSEEVCSGHFCVQDCEDGRCPYADEAMEYIASLEDDDVESSDDYLEMGFDPYLGCYTDDC